MLGVPVECPEVTQTTALGVAYLAGLGSGFWDGQEDVSDRWRRARQYEPKMTHRHSESPCEDWHRVVERSKGWEKP